MLVFLCYNYYGDDMEYLVETLLYCIIQEKLNVPDNWRMNRFVRYILIFALLLFIGVFNFMFIRYGISDIKHDNVIGGLLVIGLSVICDLWIVFKAFDLYYSKYRGMLK